MSMEIADICCNLEQGKRLVELGIARECSIFSHYEIYEKRSDLLIDTQLGRIAANYNRQKQFIEYYPAFTLTEIGKMKGSDQYYHVSMEALRGKIYDDIIFATACFIMMLENGILTPEECHKRLAKKVLVK